jgi:hypothetical protein
VYYVGELTTLAHNNWCLNAGDILALPNRLPEKLDAWKAYKASHPSADLAKWSRQHDQLQINNIVGRRAQLGGAPGSRYMTPYGMRVVDNAPATEIKTGYATLTKFHRLQIIKDSYLARTVPGYSPHWRIHGSASQPLLDKLKTFGITYEVVR